MTSSGLNFSIRITALFQVFVFFTFLPGAHCSTSPTGTHFSLQFVFISHKAQQKLQPSPGAFRQSPLPPWGLLLETPTPSSTCRLEPWLENLTYSVTRLFTSQGLLTVVLSKLQSSTLMSVECRCNDFKTHWIFAGIYFSLGLILEG